MRLKYGDTTENGIRQFAFRINEKEIESLFTTIEVAKGIITKTPNSSALKEVRRHMNIASKELNKAMKELKDEGR